MRTQNPEMKSTFEASKGKKSAFSTQGNCAMECDPRVNFCSFHGFGGSDDHLVI